MQTVRNVLRLIILIAICQVTSATKCYRCLSLKPDDDNADPYTLKNVRTAVIDLLDQYYFLSEDDVLPCPPSDPKLKYKWEDEQTSRQWDRQCSFDFKSDISCALSRFRVNTINTKGEKSVVHGTILGCPKRKLRSEALVEVKYEARESQGPSYNPKVVVKETKTTIHNCGLSIHSRDEPAQGLSHEIELEHCAANICYRDFCIDPQESEVRPFVDNTEGVYIPWTWILLAVFIVGFFVGILSMLGLKYS